MVKVREGLPLIDGKTTEQDSAAQMAEMLARQTKMLPLALDDDLNACFSDHQPKAAFEPALDPSLQPTTAQQLDASDSVQSHDSSPQFIDVPAWLAAVADRLGMDDLADLSRACQLIGSESTDHVPSKSTNTASVDDVAKTSHNVSDRSSALMTGIGMADILTYLYQDEKALSAAMLYRAARTGVVTSEQINAYFGDEVSKLVQDTLAMGKLSESIEKNKRLEDHFTGNQREQLTNIYSMLIATTNDVRVVLIKLAERTFAMRELSYASPERQQRVAREVMTIYAPLAHRLGIAQIKWELEDLAFRYLAPDRYKEIAKLLSEKRSEREDYIERVKQQLIDTLAAEGITAQVDGRVKHIYSIYRKMKLKSLSFDQLYDIRALRVLVDSKAECYHALGLVHGIWRHIPEQFDDYITNPKGNGYRSLHTAVVAESKSLEIQIRTQQMHFEAELGMCAHVNYKEGLKKQDVYLNDKIGSLRQLLLAGQDTGNPATADTTAPSSDKQDDEEQLVDFGEFERIYVFSRDGDITELPKGSTVLDFAYYVHTQVGNRAQAARVNGRYVPLTYQLKTGEQVEIITKSSREPNRDWLVSSLGYIHTSRARAKLRQWFNKQDRDKNLEIGKQMLAKELTRLSLHPNSIDLANYVKHFNVSTADDILVGLVTGDVGLHQLTGHISRELDLAPDADEQDYTPSVHPKATGKLDVYKIRVDGLDNIELRVANCCQPIYGEPIAGFITLSGGVSIHNRGCPEFFRLIEREPERRIPAAWVSQATTYQPVDILIEAYDRRGLLKDLTQVIDREDVNIRGVGTHSDDDNIAHLKFNLEVTGLSQLSKLLAKLESQPGILHARRAV